MSHAILGMFMPKKYVFGSKFQMQLGMLSVCLSHLAALCTHRSHIPARAFTGTHRAHGHAQHRKSCVFRRGASPARAQETSHAPLLPSTLSPQVPQGSVYTPRAWGCFLGPVPPQFLWEPAMAGGLVGEQRPGPRLPLGPAGRSPPVPGASLSPTASVLPAGRLVAFL